MNKKGIIIFIIGILIVTIFIFALNHNEKNVVSESTSFEEATTTSLIHSPIENEITGVGTHLLEEFEAREEHLATEDPTENQLDLQLEIIYQYPELPAGCESVSLTMLLNYYGYDLDKTYIVDNYLIYSGNFVMGYNGNPYSSSVGGGIYAPGLTITANNFLQDNGGKHYAENITGASFDELLEYISQGYPVLVWSTIHMGPCNKGYYHYDEEGNPYGWDYNEHCVVISGYDYKANCITVYDPIDGVVYRDMDDFEAIYNDMHQMAIIIRES
ncbi:MAG: C39 family peptidase [Lachnospiraceae bacterium]|nr:C39 family peptidase [Lachnospiraceae bacterium]